MARHSRENREDETAEMPITVPEVPLSEPFEDAVSRTFPVTDEEVARVSGSESGPFSLKSHDYQPMYRGGPNPYEARDSDPKPPMQKVFADVGAAAGKAFGEIAPGPPEEPPPPPRLHRGQFILALVGLTLALVAMTLALWVFLHGCDCPVSPTLTPITPTAPPPGP